MEGKILYLSTSHVTKETAVLMDKDRAGVPVYKKADRYGTYGWFVPAEAGTLPLDAPDDLQKVVLFALDNKYDWIMFDGDAAPDPRLAVYRWPEAGDKQHDLLFAETLVEMAREFQRHIDDKTPIGDLPDTDVFTDSRTERDSLILLAERFEKEHAHTDWDAPGAPDYYEAIEKAVASLFIKNGGAAAKASDKPDAADAGAPVCDTGKQRSVKWVDIRLLTEDEYKASKPYIPHRAEWWWLGTGGTHDGYVRCVAPDGNVMSVPYTCRSVWVRPVITFCDGVRMMPQWKLGRKVFLGGECWTIIGDGIAICDRAIGKSAFRHGGEAKGLTEYASSDVKDYLEAWLNSRWITIVAETAVTRRGEKHGQ